MNFSIHSSFSWSLCTTEIGVVVLSLACLVLDIFLPDEEKRGRALADAAMLGVAFIFSQTCFQWGNFGIGLNGTVAEDGLAFFFKILFLLAAFFTLFMAREYQAKLKRGHSEFVLLILFALTGMIFLSIANDFLIFFVALETLSICLYVMTSYLRDDERSIEAGVKYLVLGALSTAIFLYGLSFIYGSTGGTGYFEIQTKILASTTLPTSFIFGMVLVICSLGFKIAVVPFQLWAPDIYEGAPTPVTAFLAIGSKAAGFAALIRLVMTLFAPAMAKLSVLFGILSALTIIYGNLGAIPQTNIKRLLGYSSIGHAGYLLIGLAAFSYSGKEAVLYYLLTYLFSAGGVFLAIVAASKDYKSDDISEFRGLSKKSPILAAGMLLSLLSLAGVPPLAGFFGKFYLLWSAVKAGFFWLALIGVLNVITSLYYYLKIIKVIYMDEDPSPRPLTVSLDQKAMQYFSILGIIILGILPGPFLKWVISVFTLS